MLNPKEEGCFKTLYRHASHHGGKTYRLLYQNGDSRLATFDTIYETDNNLELDDPDYEEFNAILFCDLATGKLFEVTYHNLPASVWCDGEKVY